MFKKITSVFTSFLIMGIIFYFSSQTATESSKVSNSLLLTILNSIPFVSGYSADLYGLFTTLIRKFAHFSLYFMLGISYLFMWKNISGKGFSKKVYAVSLLSALLYAVSDEFHQYFIPGRSCELRDVIIDFSGALCGCMIIKLFTIFKNRKNKAY